MSLWDQAQHWAWSDSDLKQVLLGLGPACSQPVALSCSRHTHDRCAGILGTITYLVVLFKKRNRYREAATTSVILSLQMETANLKCSCFPISHKNKINFIKRPGKKSHTSISSSQLISSKAAEQVCLHSFQSHLDSPHSVSSLLLLSDSWTHLPEEWVGGSSLPRCPTPKG